MDRLGYKKTILSGWPATQEADQQGGEIHLRPVPRHRTLPGAVHCISGVDRYHFPDPLS
jgi:hypothetical protein